LGLNWSKDIHTTLDEQLDEVYEILRIKFHNYLQAIVKKLVENVSSVLKENLLFLVKEVF
jgi:hypothetical protein